VTLPSRGGLSSLLPGNLAVAGWPMPLKYAFLSRMGRLRVAVPQLTCSFTRYRTARCTCSLAISVRGNHRELPYLVSGTRIANFMALGANLPRLGGDVAHDCPWRSVECHPAHVTSRSTETTGTSLPDARRLPPLADRGLSHRGKRRSGRKNARLDRRPELVRDLPATEQSSESGGGRASTRYEPAGPVTPCSHSS